MTAGRKSSDDGEGGDGSARGRGPERFADLIGDARPIERKNARDRPDSAAHPKPPPRPRPSASTRGTAASAANKANATTGQSENAFRWPEPGNRHRAATAGANDALLIRLGRGEPEPEEKIDLHGVRSADAKRLLATRIESAQTRGLRCVLVVHGRGQRSATNEAVLRDGVPEWLTRGATGRRVLAFAPAPKQLGGEGATLVLLRKGEGR